MVSTPTSIHIDIALASWAWTATFFPRLCAIRTTASSSSGINSDGSPGAYTLTKSAPPPISSLVARVYSSTPETYRRKQLGSAGVSDTVGRRIIPPLMIRGPANRPRLIASRTYTERRFGVPMSRIVVKPSSKYFLALRPELISSLKSFNRTTPL